MDCNYNCTTKSTQLLHYHLDKSLAIINEFNWLINSYVLVSLFMFVS